MYRGTSSADFSSGITTPAAWVAMFLFKPSNFKESSISFFTLGSFFSSLCNLGSLAMDSFRESGLDGSNGIILHKKSTYPYGKPKTLPISLKAILDLSLPNVMM